MIIFIRCVYVFHSRSFSHSIMFAQTRLDWIWICRTLTRLPWNFQQYIRGISLISYWLAIPAHPSVARSSQRKLLLQTPCSSSSNIEPCLPSHPRSSRHCHRVYRPALASYLFRSLLAIGKSIPCASSPSFSSSPAQQNQPSVALYRHF